MLITKEALIEELHNQEHWDRSYDRLFNKGTIDPEVMSQLYFIKVSNEKLDYIHQLCNGTFEWKPPEKVLLAKSGTTKKRVVYMYSPLERFLLGVLYRALSALVQPYLAPNCFSYQRKVTTSTAISYIKKVKQSEPMYGVKLDISAYFNSVSKPYLERTLVELFGRGTPLYQTMAKLYLDDTITYKGQTIQEYKSLIPGCAMGSFFANYCLKDMDWMFYHQNKVYARYSDDIILFDYTKEALNESLAYIKEQLALRGLTINDSKYVYFDPDDPVEYLGLKLTPTGVDISDHSKKKLKATFKRWCKAARKEMELKGKSFDYVAKRLVNRWNWKIFKSYVEDPQKFGWGYYAFRYITTPESLIELDFYIRDRLRALKTGKNNKANVKALSDEDFQRLGVLSLYEMYRLFHEDFDYYLEVAYLV